MSIDVAIRVLCTKGELEFVSPSLPGLKVQRDVFATAEVMKLIGDGGGLDAEFEKVGGRARSKIDGVITAGKTFVFGMAPLNKSVTCLIARNAPLWSGILDIRVNDPEPAVRIFGCSVKRDALVLLTYAQRQGLKFGHEVRRARREWRRLFPNHHPLISNDLDEYFTNVLPG